MIFTGKHLCRGLYFNKVAGHQACNFVKKRLQHRYFLANIGKFIRRPILKNISKRLHCWKVFCENVFQIRSELSKRNYWWLAVWKVAQISQDWIKMLPIIKYYVRRLNSSDKKQQIFFCTTVSKFQEISTLNNICDGAKQIYPKK